MKLKTLKDFPKLSTGENEYKWVSVEELKAEAIKWVKEFDKRMCTMTRIDFMKFHNITGEDLKR